MVVSVILVSDPEEDFNVCDNSCRAAVSGVRVHDLHHHQNDPNARASGG
jgi:hypothetical protein